MFPSSFEFLERIVFIRTITEVRGVEQRQEGFVFNVRGSRSL